MACYCSLTADLTEDADGVSAFSTRPLTMACAHCSPVAAALEMASGPCDQPTTTTTTTTTTTMHTTTTQQQQQHVFSYVFPLEDRAANNANATTTTTTATTLQFAAAFDLAVAAQQQPRTFTAFLAQQTGAAAAAFLRAPPTVPILFPLPSHATLFDQLRLHQRASSPALVVPPTQQPPPSQQRSTRTRSSSTRRPGQPAAAPAAAIVGAGNTISLSSIAPSHFFGATDMHNSDAMDADANDSAMVAGDARSDAGSDTVVIGGDDNDDATAPAEDDATAAGEDDANDDDASDSSSEDMHHEHRLADFDDDDDVLPSPAAEPSFSTVVAYSPDMTTASPETSGSAFILEWTQNAQDDDHENQDASDLGGSSLTSSSSSSPGPFSGLEFIIGTSQPPPRRRGRPPRFPPLASSQAAVAQLSGFDHAVHAQAALLIKQEALPHLGAGVVPPVRRPAQVSAAGANGQRPEQQLNVVPATIAANPLGQSQTDPAFIAAVHSVAHELIRIPDDSLASLSLTADDIDFVFVCLGSHEVSSTAPERAPESTSPPPSSPSTEDLRMFAGHLRNNSIFFPLEHLDAGLVRVLWYIRASSKKAYTDSIKPVLRRARIYDRDFHRRAKGEANFTMMIHRMRRSYQNIHNKRLWRQANPDKCKSASRKRKDLEAAFAAAADLAHAADNHDNDPDDDDDKDAAPDLVSDDIGCSSLKMEQN